MAELVVGVATALLSIITKALQVSEQKKQNVNVLLEFNKFIQDLQINIQQLQNRVLCTNTNSAQCALDALQKDLEAALVDASNILNKDFVRSRWNSTEIQFQIRALNERVMTSFQTRLSMVSLDVALDSKHAQDAFQTSMQKELQRSLRRKLRKSLKILTTAIKAQSLKIEAAISMMHSVQPQTSDAGGLSVEGDGGGGASTHPCCSNKQSAKELKWYQDPLTWKIMVDPVKATDGHTYDRWTVICGKMSIAVDDLDVRSRLFQKFPYQEARLKSKRAKYRDDALREATFEHYEDAAMMLKHVLEWAPRDIECNEKLQYIQKIIADDTERREQDITIVENVSICAVANDTDQPHESINQGLWQSSMNAIENTSFMVMKDDTELLASRELSESWQDALESTTSSAIGQPQLLHPSRLDSARSNTRLLAFSSNGLVCKFHSTHATVTKAGICVGAAIADVAVPAPDEKERPTSVFYFEVSIVEGDNVVGVGFAGSDSFCDDRMPGSYYNSCGYHGDSGSFFSKGRKCYLSKHVAKPIVAVGDKIGAGVHHGLNQLFFVHNGSPVYSILNRISGPLMPVVALGSVSGHIKVAFGNASFPFYPKQERPSRLLVPCIDMAAIVSLSADGLTACYAPTLQNKVATLRADCGVWPRDVARERFYFEMTITDVDKDDKDTSLTIGFTYASCYRKDWRPGLYRGSCGYRGGDGNLFIGCWSMAQELFGPTFSLGDIVGAGIDFVTDTTFFVKNGRKVGHTRWLRISSCDLCPIIGMQSSKGITVQLNFGQAPFSFNACMRSPLHWDEQQGEPASTRLLCPRYKTPLYLCAKGLVACYKIKEGEQEDQDLQLDALMADRPICLRRACNGMYYFELTVLKGGVIAIGFCVQGSFCQGKQPGCYRRSWGYHLDDGRTWNEGIEGEGGAPCSFGRAGDVVGAGFDFASNTIFFIINGQQVGEALLLGRPERLCAVVGLHRPASVRMNFGQASFTWNKELVE